MSTIEYLDLAQWQRSRDEFDGAVLKTPGILRFCSGASWQLAAHENLCPDRKLLIARRGESWQLWAVGPVGHLPEVLQPMETEWLFGCPLVGPHPERTFHFFLQTALETSHRYPAVLLSGILQGSLSEKLILSRFPQHFHVRRLPGFSCRVASLQGGAEAFLSRRSGRFRRQLKRLEQQADSSGIRCCRFGADSADIEALFTRILQIETTAWKEQSGVGIFGHERYRNFYRNLLGGLEQSGCLRLITLEQDGQDLAYAVGGVASTYYRGLQMSFRRDGPLAGIGHLAQWKMIEMLVEEGITEYDLGMDLEYKRRWADREDRVDNFLLLRK